MCRAGGMRGPCEATRSARACTDGRVGRAPRELQRKARLASPHSMPIEYSGCTRRVVVRPFAALVESGRHLTPVDLRFRGARFPSGGLPPPDSPVPPGPFCTGHRLAGQPGGFAAFASLLHKTWSDGIFGQSGAGGNRTPLSFRAEVLVRDVLPAQLPFLSDRC